MQGCQTSTTLFMQASFFPRFTTFLARYTLALASLKNAKNERLFCRVDISSQRLLVVSLHVVSRHIGVVSRKSLVVSV